MKVILISTTAKRLDELRHGVETEGHEIVQALLRQDGRPLSALLAHADCDLLIVDSTSAEQKDDFAALEALIAAHPSLAVIMLSESRGADTLTAAMQAGIREVLRSRPSASELAGALQRVLKHNVVAPAAAAHGRVIAFISCKGGSGATFLATNLAYLLATECRQSTALIDLDLQYADASYLLAEVPAKASIVDLARQIERLDANLLAAYMMQIAPNFGLLAAPEQPEAALDITADQLERVLAVARQSYDFVVIDLERKLDAVSIKALDTAELIFPVMQNTIPSARDARRLVRAFRELGYADSKLRLVVNRYDARSAVKLEELETAVGLKVAHTIANSYAMVVESLNTGVPLLRVNAKNPVARGLRVIADEITGNRPRSWLDRRRRGAST